MSIISLDPLLATTKPIFFLRQTMPVDNTLSGLPWMASFLQHSVFKVIHQHFLIWILFVTWLSNILFFSSWVFEQFSEYADGCHCKTLQLFSLLRVYSYKWKWRFCFYFCFLYYEILCSPGWPQAFYLDQTGLELLKIPLSLLP